LYDWGHVKTAVNIWQLENKEVLEKNLSFGGQYKVINNANHTGKIKACFHLSYNVTQGSAFRYPQ
jgi:hypothetical protein